MKKLGVFATKEETEKMKQMLINAQKTPVIAFSGKHALRGGMVGDAYNILYRESHRLALLHGLPEFEGYYGLDCETGEFLLPE